MMFRSGNSAGADELFAKGVAAVDPGRIEIVTPYKGHRKKYSQQFRNYSLDEIELAAEQDLLKYSKKIPANVNLIERYSHGYRDNVGIKGAYLLRDTLMVLGAKSLPLARASFALFYDDLIHPRTGGTGYTMKVCDSLEIPYVDQRIWRKWIK